jgi:hypothetical protein
MANAPGTTSFDVDAARKAGYSDAEIADYLGGEAKWDTTAARQAGYSDQEIIDHLTQAQPLINKPGGVEDTAKSVASGLEQAFGRVADAVENISPPKLLLDHVAAPGAKIANAALAATMGKDAPQIDVPTLPSVSSLAPSDTNYTPQTAAGRYAKSVAENAPNAVMPGGVAARAANIFLPGVAGQGAADAAHALGANQTGQDVARVVGSVAGGAAASLRAPNPYDPPETDAQVAADLLVNKGKLNPAQMEARANLFRGAGVTPSAIDVVGDQGRRLIKAVGVTNPDAGETLADNARQAVASTKGAVMNDTRNIGPMPGTTADQLTDSIESSRDAAATTNYAGPYQTQVPLSQDIKDALSDAPGRAALQRALRAAVARQDDAQVQEIQGLLRAGSPMPQPPSRLDGLQSVKTPVTVNQPAAQTYPWPDTVSGATLDRLQIAFRNQGARLQRNQAGDIASGLFGRQAQINGTLDQVPELADARADYANKSGALDILSGKARMDPYSTDPADYAKWVASLTPEQKAANAVAIRQDILNTLGGQRSNTFGSVDELASSQYADPNLRAALGDEAGSYLNTIRARLTQMRNAQATDAGRGSQSVPLANDMAGLMKMGAQVVGKGLRQDWLGLAMMWLKSRGVSDQEAQALASASTDSNQLPAVLARVQSRLDAKSARQFLIYRNAALIGSGAMTMGASQPAPAQAQPGPRQ